MQLRPGRARRMRNKDIAGENVTTTLAGQHASSGYGLVYWLFYLFRRWIVTFWSLAIVLSTPFDAWFTTPISLAAPFDLWFVTPIFLAALLFDILLTPRALDLRIGIRDLEQEIETDRPLAAVLEGWPMPPRPWRSFRLFLWLTLVYLALFVALLVVAPADTLRWGYINLVSYTFCGTALGSILLVPIQLSMITKKYACTFGEYANDIHAQSAWYISLVKIFPGKLRFRASMINSLMTILFIWSLTLFVFNIISKEHVNTLYFREYFIILFGPMLPLLFNVFTPQLFWRQKIVLSLRKTDPLAGRHAKEIPRQAIFLEKDQSGEAKRRTTVIFVLLILVPAVAMTIYVFLFVDFGYLKCTGRRALDPDARIGYCTGFIDSYTSSDERLIDPYLFHDVTDHAEALRRRGMAYAEKGDGERAIQDLDEAIRLVPDDPVLYNSRCWAHGLMRQPENALVDCNESLRLRPDHPATLDSRSFAYWLLKEPEKARQDLERARQFDPTVPHWEERFREFDDMF